MVGINPAYQKDRPLLAELRGQTITVTGTFVRLGCFKNDMDVGTVTVRALFCDVRHGSTRQFLASHMWVEAESMRLGDLVHGDRVTMTGRVRRYKRYGGSPSYHLDNIAVEGVNGRSM